MARSPTRHRRPVPWIRSDAHRVVGFEMLFVRDLWRGRLRLWITYWLCGVGGNMSFVALLLLVYAARGAAAEASLWLVYACSLAWFILIFVGNWRAAGRYPGPPVWALLARLGVLVGIVRMAGEALLLARL